MTGISADGLYFDLNLGADNFTLPGGLLSTLTGGLRALAGNDIVTGSADSEAIYAGKGDDLILGGAGNDSLWGDRGNESLSGDDGNDFLAGLRGTDTLTGGIGDDIFLLGTETAATDVATADIITDFGNGSDRISLASGLTEADLTLESLADGTLIKLTASGAILGVASGVQPEQLSGRFGADTGPIADPGGESIPLSTARDLGIVGSVAVNDSVGVDNPQDLYRFTLSADSEFSLLLDGLSADADVELIQDFDNNGLFEQGIDFSEAIAASAEPGNTSEAIAFTNLSAGTYFVRVLQYEGDTSYNLSLNASLFAPPSDEVGNDLSQARNLGTLNGRQAVSEFVGNTDPNDYYRFNLDATSEFSLSLDGLSDDADVQLIEDLNGNGIDETDEVIAASEVVGSASEAIDFRALPAGAYFVRVFPFNGDTLYNLSLSATPIPDIPDDGAGNTLSQARDIGTLTTTQSFSDVVGAVDTDDFYRFTVNEDSFFSLVVDGLSADADVQLIKDIDSNGVIEEREIIDFSQAEGTDSEAIAIDNLDAGTYFVNIFPYNGDTSYNLSLSATSLSSAPDDGAGNTIAEARDIGTLTGTQSFEDFVGLLDRNDFYRFTVNETGNFSLTLDGLSADADVDIFQDLNGNGLEEAEEVLSFSENQGTSSETITDSNLAPGTYFIRVYPFDGDTNYNVSLSLGGQTPPEKPPEAPPKDGGNSLATAVQQSSSTFTATGEVNGTEPDDFYKFKVDQSGVFTADLTGLTADADVRVIRDFNSNGQIDKVVDRNNNEFIDDDEIEVLGWLPERGNGNESIRAFLQPGDYFLQVDSFDKQATNYSVASKFTAAASDPQKFDIQLNRKQGTELIDPKFLQALEEAANTWERIISSSFEDPHTLTIDISGKDLGFDPRGFTLALAGADNFDIDRNGRNLAISGSSEININPAVYGQGSEFMVSDFRNTMTHEFGHVLGLVGLVNSADGQKFFTQIKDTTYRPDTFVGLAYGQQSANNDRAAAPIYSKSGQRDGSNFSHWDEITFKTELMTPFLNSGVVNPLSELTIAALRDNGWSVNYGAAEEYSLPTSSSSRTSLSSSRVASSVSNSSLSVANSSVARTFKGVCGCANCLRGARQLNTLGTSSLADAIS